MEEDSLTTGYETRDADIRAIALTLAGLAVCAALVCVLVYGILRYLESHPLTETQSSPMEEISGPQLPPPPRLEEHPAIEIEALHAQENAVLSTYGWVDKNAGKVRIPIDRAMELQLQRGFPTHKEGSR